MAILDLKKSNI